MIIYFNYVPETLATNDGSDEDNERRTEKEIHCKRKKGWKNDGIHHDLIFGHLRSMSTLNMGNI